MNWNPATLLAVTTLLSVPLGAQDNEPLLASLRNRFQTEELRIGALFQHVSDFQIDRTMPGNNGFSIANFRVSLGGELDGGFSYFLQTAFTGSPGMLDARMSYQMNETTGFDAGLFKSPFSSEFLTAASSIDFVNRSQVVTALAPGRQVGAQLRLLMANGQSGITVGAFNGNAAAVNGNDSGGLLYAARVHTSVSTPDDEGTVRFGANVATSEDGNASGGNGFLSGFTGRRTLAGADVRMEKDQLLLAAEVDGAVLAPTVGARRTPFGVHATAGWMVQPGWQMLARADLFDPDNGFGRSDWLVLGMNRWPTGATEIQANYIISLNDAAVDRHQILVNLQIGF